MAHTDSDNANISLGGPAAAAVAGNAELHQRARRLTPAGVHSNARLVGADTVFTHGDGPWLFDADGNRYVDYMLGRGPAVLGHTPTTVNDAVARAAARGLTLGSATPLEVEAAEAALSLIPWADHIRFTSTGTEAVQQALRIARAATGRNLIVQFEGLYHGWIDSVSLEPGNGPRNARPATLGQVPNSGEHTVLLPWNDADAVTAAFEQWGEQIAAVLTEPVSVFGGELARPGYLQHLRDLTTRHGALLIFDEVVTGFRLQPGSAASLVGVTPDIGTYAKAMGSGWAVSAVAARSELFDGVAADRVRLSGTYNGNAPAMAAVIATVELTADGSLHRRLNEWGDGLRAALQRTASDMGVGVVCEGYPSAFWLVFDGMDRAASNARAEALGLALRDERLIQYHHTWLPSAAHDDEALDFTLRAFAAALAR
jgi:glutamate-1-semialdehyde 2,1-aminomutase